MNTVDTDYFSSMRIPIVSGRDFTDDDGDETLRVVIINQAMAARYWPNQDAIGKRLRLAGNNRYLQIVGIAKNANYQSLGESPRSCIYVPLQQNFSDSMVLYLRTLADPGQILPTAQRVIHEIDPQMPIPDARTGRKIIDQALWTAAVGVSMLSLFGLLALGLASIGLYGLLSYSVHQRQREISIRMAPGAGRMQILRLIVRQGMGPVLIGTAIGIALSIVSARAVQHPLRNKPHRCRELSRIFHRIVPRFGVGVLYARPVRQQNATIRMPAKRSLAATWRYRASFTNIVAG